jgi:hypothetical protein
MKRSGFVQLRVNRCRSLACYRFYNIKGYEHFLEEIGLGSLKLLEDYSTKAEMKKFGRAFMYDYMYGRWAAGYNFEIKAIDNWTGKATNRADPMPTGCTLREVCPCFYESNVMKILDVWTNL